MKKKIKINNDIVYDFINSSYFLLFNLKENNI